VEVRGLREWGRPARHPGAAASSAVESRLETLRLGLRKQFDFIAGIAFPHDDGK
jgi:hypothetical protein